MICSPPFIPIQFICHQFEFKNIALPILFSSFISPATTLLHVEFSGSRSSCIVFWIAFLTCLILTPFRCSSARWENKHLRLLNIFKVQNPLRGLQHPASLLLPPSQAHHTSTHLPHYHQATWVFKFFTGATTFTTYEPLFPWPSAWDSLLLLVGSRLCLLQLSAQVFLLTVVFSTINYINEILPLFFLVLPLTCVTMCFSLPLDC